jgi:uncharacterized protein
MSDRIGNLAIAAFVAIYAASLITLDRLGALSLEDAGELFIVLGLAFSLLAWFVTIGIKPIEIEIVRPKLEGLVAIMLVAAVGAYLVYGRTWVDAQFAGDGPMELDHLLWITVAKLVVFVAAPYVVFKLVFGETLASFGLSRTAFARLAGRDGLAVLVVAAAICIFQFYNGQAAEPIRTGAIAGETLWVGGALTFIWLVFDAGLVEEFFFRGLLQERASAALRSPVAGLVLMALIFGLVHAPGMVLRGAGGVEGLGEHPDALAAAAYTIAVQSVAGFFLGIVWMRTRNLPAVILIHAATDLLPNLPRFLVAMVPAP